MLSTLGPLRSGAPPISPADLEAASKAWMTEQTEWIRRRNVYHTAFEKVNPEMRKEEKQEWEEEMGIEGDTEVSI